MHGEHCAPLPTSHKEQFSMQTILFDLDGTLIDHFTTIHRSIAHAQRQLGLPESNYATVRATVGGGVSVTLERLLGKQHVDAALPLFREHFEQIMFEDVLALPGAAWILEVLKQRGHPLAVFTNKIGDHSRATLKHLDMDRWLDAIVGTGDTPYRKPEPQFTAHMLELMETTSAETILIGDSPFDFAAAEVGGLKCYLVATGSHSVAELKESTTAAGVYNDLYELGNAVFQLQRETTTA
jgi:phosphoglycolate phosphatase